MKRTAVYLLVSALWLFCSCGAEISLRKGDQSYALGEYQDAAAKYKKAYAGLSPQEKELRGSTAFKLGESYRKINYVPRALAAYQNAVRYKYPDSIVYRHLADMQRYSGNLKDAEKNYKIQDTGVGNLSLLHGIFRTHGSNKSFTLWRMIYKLSCKRSPYRLWYKWLKNSKQVAQFLI